MFLVVNLRQVTSSINFMHCSCAVPSQNRAHEQCTLHWTVTWGQADILKYHSWGYECPLA